MILNRIIPENDHILRKNQNGFMKISLTSGQILTIHRILVCVKSKNLSLTLLFIDFTKSFDSIHRNLMEFILRKYGIITEIIICIIFVIKDFLTDYKLLFDTEFKSENHFAQSALVLFVFNFLFFWKYPKFPKENIGFHINYSIIVFPIVF